MSDRRTAIPAGVLVATAVVSVWLSFGVSISEVVRFVAYEVMLVGLPGVLAYRVLSPSPGGALRQVAIGWPLGYAIEVGAFILTAGADVRGLFPVIPLAVAGVAAGYLWHKRGSSTADTTRGWPDGDVSEERAAAPVALPSMAVWAIAAVAAIAVGYLALGYFTATPLPRDVASVSYAADNVFDIGVIAEAKNHWPMQYPGVADTPLRYHINGFVHMAAVSQVTGIEPSTLLFRLVPATLIVLLTLQVAALGRALGRSVWLGPLAAALVLLIGELDLDPERPSPFADTFFTDLPLSPSFLFGIPPFLAITMLLLVALSRRGAPRPGEWTLLGILLVVAGGAKASVLPVILGGLVLWLGWAWLQRRKLDRTAVAALGLGVAAFAITYALLYSGGGGGGFTLGIFGFTDFTVIDELVDPATRSPLGDVLLTGATGVLGIAALCLPTLGIVWVIRTRRLRLEPAEAWLLALFLASLGAFLFLAHPAFAQAYFLNYGYIAGSVLAAEGIVLFLGRARASWNRPVAVLAPLLAAALAAGAGAAVLLDVHGVEMAGLGRLAIGYGVIATAIAALAVAAWRAASAEGRAGAAAGVALLMTISLGLLNTPLDDGVPVLKNLRADADLHAHDDPAANRGLTGQLYDGLRWVRDHSEEDEVIAVNNHSLDADGLNSRYFYFTAFSERRAFLESWHYTRDAAEIGFDRVSSGEKIPFPRLRRLNSEAFDRANPEALETMSVEYGVDYLLVDRVHGSASPELARLGRPVFENDALVVYRLPRPG